MTQYIRVPGTDTLIAREETLKGKTWNDTHYALSKDGLSMPSPSLFMLHYSNVRGAAQGKTTLYNGDKDAIPRKGAKDLWERLSSNCWTWFDARFEQTDSGLILLTDHRIINNNPQPLTIEQLEDCVMETCYVDLTFNKQGLPTQKSKKQEYKQGSNIYFWHPINGSVAGFYASSDWSDFGCDGGVGLSFVSLGVFAARKFSEDSTTLETEIQEALKNKTAFTHNGTLYVPTNADNLSIRR